MDGSLHIEVVLSKYVSQLGFESDHPKRGLEKILKRYEVQLGHCQQNLGFYIEPYVVERLKSSTGPAQYSDKIDSGEILETPPGLVGDVKAFLDDNPDEQVMLLLGEPGAGKSLFTWYFSQQQLRAYQTSEGSGTPSQSTCLMWLSVL